MSKINHSFTLSVFSIVSCGWKQNWLNLVTEYKPQRTMQLRWTDAVAKRFECHIRVHLLTTLCGGHLYGRLTDHLHDILLPSTVVKTARVWSTRLIQNTIFQSVLRIQQNIKSTSTINFNMNSQRMRHTFKIILVILFMPAWSVSDQ